MPNEAAHVGDEVKVDPTPRHKDDPPPVAVTFIKGVLTGLVLGGIAGGLVLAGMHAPAAKK